jgi:HAAS domain-containing protein
MTDDEQIKNYLRRVRLSLHLHRKQRRRVLEEIESHLDEGTAAYMRSGATRTQAIERTIEDLGPPEAVAEAFTDEGAPRPNRTGMLRWLPMVLPIFLLTVTVVFILWSLIDWVPGGLTRGERVVERVYLRAAVIAAILSYAAYFSIGRADRDRAWRWAAWACTGCALLPLALW